MRWIAGPALLASIAGCAAASVPPPSADPVVGGLQVVVEPQPAGNTLERLRQQNAAPRRIVPAGVLMVHDVTGALPYGDRLQIAQHLLGCLAGDTLPPGTVMYAIALFDPQGMMEQMLIHDPPGSSPPDAGQRAAVARSLTSLNSSQCRKLPLPDAVLGKPGRISLRFTP